MKFILPFFHRREDTLILGRTGAYSFFPTYTISNDQRATHMYVLGITGQGKSKLLEHLLFQDIIAGRGCGLLDPHTDLAQDLLAYLAESGFFNTPANVDRIIYFDPSRKDYLIPFNVLATSFPAYATATNLVEAFRRTWPESLHEAPRFSNVLLAGLLILMTNQLTLVELPRLLMDRTFRDNLLEHVDDPEIVSVFRDRVERWGREERLMLESILNKVSAFTLNPVLRLLLGQKENRLDFRRIMDEEKVLIVDLGRCDGETRRLLGSLIVTGLEQAALSRKDELTRQRKPFYFYIDEFQDFVANEGSAMTLAHILSEARKFGLHLTLAHQILGQMTSDAMRLALGNIGTKIVFSVDRLDAEIMAKKLFEVSGETVKHDVTSHEAQARTHPLFYSVFEEWEQAIQAIQHLKPRTCLIKSSQRQVVQVHTVTVPPHHLSEGELEELRVALLQKNGQPYWQMQEQIQQRRRVEQREKRITDYEPIEGRREPVTMLGSTI